MAEDPSWARLRAKLAKIKTKMKDFTPVNRRVGELVVRSVLRNFRAGGRPKWKTSMRVQLFGGTVLHSSGELKRSVNFTAHKDSVIIGTNKPYSALQHFGGTITPKSKQYLTIPIGLSRQEQRQGKRAKDFSDTFIAKSGAGNLIIFQNVASGIKPLFLLSKSVTIPPRPFLVIQEEDDDAILREYSKHIGLLK